MEIYKNEKKNNVIKWLKYCVQNKIWKKLKIAKEVITIGGRFTKFKKIIKI